MPFVTGPLPQRLKLVHGFGAVAFGVKDSGFSFFLLPFYNLVLGVDAGTVGAALATALVIDAIVDPLIGHFSDRTYTRWGRRLPWLYLAPWPLALLWTMLWSPPFTGTPGFWDIVALAVGVRLLLSACEVPSVSLVPEITDDYDDRTTLFRYRFLSGWLGGLLMMVLSFTVFLPTPESQLQPEGYASYGLFGAALMVLAVVGSAAAQHRIVAHLPERKPGRFSLTGAFAEIFDAFREKAFVIFALGGLAAYVLQGMTFSITQYVNLYVWQFSELAFQLYPAVLFLSVLLMFVIVGPLHRKWGKPRSAAGGAIVGMAFYCTPYALYQAGAWPDPGSTASTGLLYAFLIHLDGRRNRRGLRGTHRPARRRHVLCGQLAGAEMRHRWRHPAHQPDRPVDRSRPGHAAGRCRTRNRYPAGLAVHADRGGAGPDRGLLARPFPDLARTARGARRRARRARTATPVRSA